MKDDDEKPTIIGICLYNVSLLYVLDVSYKLIDFWDTAGQEAFSKMHPSYYYRAHCCILVFDVTRKMTYQHLNDWYAELREHCGENIPCILVANKIDVDYNVSCMLFRLEPIALSFQRIGYQKRV